MPMSDLAWIEIMGKHSIRLGYETLGWKALEDARLSPFERFVWISEYYLSSLCILKCRRRCKIA